MAHACTLIGGCRGGQVIPKSTISTMSFKLSVEKESQTYVAGETIHGSLHIFHIPWKMEEVCGMMIQFQGEYFSGPNNTGVKIIEIKEYFIGSAWKTTELKPGDYKFSITVPKCSPCSFSTERSSSMKYTLKLIANRMRDGVYTMSHKTIIIANEILQKWDNQEYLCRPMVAVVEKKIVDGNILLELNTDRKCYQPGDEIEFSLKTVNAGEKTIACVTLQLQQNVKMSKQFDKNLLVGLNNGPPVPINSTRIWSGVLEIPRILPPSDQGGSPKNTEIEFQYYLTVILKMAGSSATSVSEEFPIRIGSPLVDSWQLRIRPRSNSTLTLNTPGQFGISQLMRRTSLISLTPSLPDYHTALLRSVLPPAYSCLDLQDSPSPSAPSLPETAED